MKVEAEVLPTGFVGRAPRIVQIRAQIEKIAPNRNPVLIQGESGTGKEVAARALFNACPRGRFVPIDCGSLVGPLMESELFGHTRHAFTGAGEATRGLIEVASGGTAFFDEIGDLPIELQVKLLRIIQEQEFRPVGSTQRVKVSVRVVAATHRNLEREIAAGRFRADLFHRLNVLRITLPPLRERKQDIPLLADRFLESQPARHVLAPEVQDAMMSYDWPGNVRELKNCIDRMVAMASGPLLRFEDLPTSVAYHVRAAAGSQAAAAVVAGLPGAHAVSGIRPLREVERFAIEQALIETHGDRTEAAHLLGIGRTTLYRKLKEYESQPGGATC